MDKESLTISVGEQNFSTPSEYIPSRIRAGQEDQSTEDFPFASNSRFGLSKLLRLSPKDWQIVDALIVESRSTRPPLRRKLMVRPPEETV